MAKRVAKSYAEMREEVQKFNPFHDALGRFSSSHGFKSYSANPKTRAGALAIQRSNSAGHGRTLNVHRESKGESVQQNANWLATGQKPKVPAAVSRQRYQQRKLKQQQAAAQQAAQKPAAPAASKPAAAPKGPQTAQKPPAQAPKQTQAQKPANQHKMAQGKDITKTFKYDSNSKKQIFDQVTEAQGMDGLPKVVKKAEFDKAVAASGIIAFRTWGAGTDVVTGKDKTAKDFKNDFKTADHIQAAGHGGRLYGDGTYIATNPKPVPGRMPNSNDRRAALNDSKNYGNGRKTTAQITLDPSAKIADYWVEKAKWKKLPQNIQNQFGGSIGAYLAAKGFDGARAEGAGWGCDYVTIYNRTKVIVLDD